MTLEDTRVMSSIELSMSLSLFFRHSVKPLLNTFHF